MSLRFAKLTRPAIRALPIGGKIAEHGITAARLANRDVSYSINVMVDGERIHRTVGKESEGITRDQASDLIETLRTRAREGRLNLAAGRKLHRSFLEAAAEYLTRMEQTGGKDLTNKRRHFRMYLIPYFGNTKINSINGFDLELYRKERKVSGATDATINREMATLQHMLNRAASKEWSWMKADDLPKIPKLNETRKKIRILTDVQRTALLNAARHDQDRRAWLFVMFGLNTSMRHSEIVGRRYDEVDFEQCRIWINRAKAGEREQPITPALRDALLTQRNLEAEGNRDGWIFPAVRPGTKHPHRRDMREAFARSARRAGLDPRSCTPHLMRHTAITALVQQRVDVPTIQKISGHKTPAMVMHYVHVFGRHIDEAISGLNIGGGAITQELRPVP